MSNFSTRSTSNASPLVNGFPSEKVDSVPKPLPSPPVKTQTQKPVPPPKSPVLSSNLDQESVTLLEQGIDSSSSQKISRNSSKVPRVSGQSSQSETEIQAPSGTLLKHLSHQDQAKELDGYVQLGQKQVKSLTSPSDPPSPNQLSSTVLVGGGPDTFSLRGRLNVSNLGDTGMTLVLSGGIAVKNSTEYIDQGQRILQTRSRQGDLQVGLSGTVGDVAPVFGSLGIGGGYDVAYARQVRSGENLALARKTEPPSREQISKDPTNTLQPGDEIAFRGFLNVGVSVGAMDPHSGFKVSLGVDVQNEFITSIKRSESDPPSFRLHIEPGNRSIDGKATVGWGPFAVSGGLGYASTVYYEFDMTPEALSGFLKTGKLPVLPDPKSYLQPGKVLTEEVFQPFHEQAQHTGISLVGFGATQSTSKSLELSATVGKVSTRSEKTRAVYVQEGEVLRQDVHTLIAGRSAWFRGELSTSLGLTQSDRFTRVHGRNELVPRYAGLEAAFQIADSKTGQEDLQERVDQANHLLGRVSSNGLTLPTRSDGNWGKSSVLIKANLTPEVIDRLADLDPDKGNVKFQIEFMAREYGVSASDVRHLLSDLKDLATGPDKDLIRREQGLRIAGFLASGYSSVVTDEELKRIAVLDRILGGGLAELKVASSIHTDKISALGVDGFLSETRLERLGEMTRTMGTGGHEISDLLSRISNKDWDRFNVAAQKLNALEIIHEDLRKDHLLDKDEKAMLLKQVDEQLNGLGDLLGSLLESPSGRGKVMSGLLGAGSLLPKVLYTSPEEMFDDPQVKRVFLGQVVGSAFLYDATAEELSGLLTKISREGKGSTGIEQVFQILSLAGQNDMQKAVLNGMAADDIAELFPRMNREQQSAFMQTLHSVTEVGSERQEAIMTLIEKSREKSDEKFQKFQNTLQELTREMSKLEGDLPKDKYLMEHFKNGYKEVDRPLQQLQGKINDSQDLLGQVGHQVLLGRAHDLESRLETFFGQMETLTQTQRQALFKQVLSQDKPGEASAAMLKHLIGGSQSETELLGFAQSLQERLQKSQTSITLPHQKGDVKALRATLQECLLDIQLRLS